MYDQSLLMQTLSRFAVVLPARYDLPEALSELTESVTAVLDLCGSWVTMADGERLSFLTGGASPLRSWNAIMRSCTPSPAHAGTRTPPVRCFG
jgi:hypothetical protein